MMVRITLVLRDDEDDEDKFADNAIFLFPPKTFLAILPTQLLVQRRALVGIAICRTPRTKTEELKMLIMINVVMINVDVDSEKC